MTSPPGPAPPSFTQARGTCSTRARRPRRAAASSASAWPRRRTSWHGPSTPATPCAKRTRAGTRSRIPEPGARPPGETRGSSPIQLAMASTRSSRPARPMAQPMPAASSGTPGRRTWRAGRFDRHCPGQASSVTWRYRRWRSSTAHRCCCSRVPSRTSARGGGLACPTSRRCLHHDREVLAGPVGHPGFAGPARAGSLLSAHRARPGWGVAGPRLHRRLRSGRVRRRAQRSHPPRGARSALM